MSPEQAEGSGNVDARTDIYSLACVVYEMVAGEPPYTGTSPSMIIARKMMGSAPPLSVTRDSVPEALERVMRKAIAKSPVDRFQSAHEFGDALDLKGAPVERLGVSARSRMRPAAAALAALAVTIGAWWAFTQTSGGASAGNALAAMATTTFLDSVAVLPVENRTGDAALDNVGAALSEGIAGELKRLGRIKVTDPFSVRHFLEADLSSAQLSDSLGVEKLVRGSVYRDAESMWVRVVTTEGATGNLLWQKIYPLDEADAYGSAARIAQAFGEDYGENEPVLASAIEMGHSAHASGQEAYLLGKTWLGRRTREGLGRAREMFRQAIALDPDYAEAFAGLSKAHALTLAYRYRSDLGGYRDAGLALGLATRAIQLEPEGAGGYSARGYIATRSFAPPEEVAADCERAIELAPGAPIEIDPRNAGRRLALAYEALALGRYDRAIEEARTARAIQPELMLPRAIEARALLLNGDPEECVAMELGPHAGIRAMCLYALGRGEEAAAIADSIAVDLSSPALRDTLFSEVVRAEDLCTYYAWTGDAELALAWLEYAFERSPSGVEARVLESALFEKIADDPAFRDAVDQIREGVWARVQQESAVALP
jgi:serine/threonine-protein kinase